jgi:hypothetical protein
MALPVTRPFAVLAAVAVALTAVALQPPDAESRTRLRVRITQKIPMPQPGDVTLARVQVTVKVKRGRRLPTRLRLNARVKNRRTVGRSVNVFFAATKAKRRSTRRTRTATLIGLAAVVRPKTGTASRAVTAQQGSDGTRELINVILEMFGQTPDEDPDDPHVRDREKRMEREAMEEAMREAQVQSQTNALNPPDTPPTSDLIPEVKRFCDGEDSQPSVDSVLGDLGKVFSIAQAGFSPRQNLRFAFAAGCRISGIPVPDRWLTGNGLDFPADRYTRRLYPQVLDCEAQGSGPTNLEPKEISYPTTPGSSVTYTWYPQCSTGSFGYVCCYDADTGAVSKSPPGITRDSNLVRCGPSDPPECRGRRIDVVFTRTGA